MRGGATFGPSHFDGDPVGALAVSASAAVPDASVS